MDSIIGLHLFYTSIRTAESEGMDMFRGHKQTEDLVHFHSGREVLQLALIKGVSPHGSSGWDGWNSTMNPLLITRMDHLASIQVGSYDSTASYGDKLSAGGFQTLWVGLIRPDPKENRVNSHVVPVW